MSWLLNLYETYESNLDRVGVIEKKQNEREYTLLPTSHTTQNAHIEVVVTENGKFHSATAVEKGDTSTLIPCTEESASRAGSKNAPYPLHDKLSYVAGDFAAFDAKKERHFTKYIKQLEEWANSPYGNDKVKSIYKYLSKKQLIKDLVKEKVMFLDADNQLIKKWDKKYESLHGEKPSLFSVINGDQESAFIRFTVHSPDKILKKVWNDKEMYESFTNFYKDLLSGEELCFVTGELLPSTDRHANKIRNAADKAKLISANDTSGFTFRGRFSESNEVATISYEASQKAHNALKWLINRQGKTVDQRVFLVWGNSDHDIPDPNEDLFAIDPAPIENKARISHTRIEFAREIAKALGGYKNDLTLNSTINIIILDSATTGRLAVLYYRNMNKELYLDRLTKWHSTCAWLHRYRKDGQGEFVQFYGAPATKDIAFAAYGLRANDKIVKGLMERILPCIIDDRKIPRDIVKSAFRRASNPMSMDKWEWEKTLSITCALINSALINKQEGYDVALNTENNDRDYLFGRLLAIADVLERRALGSDVNRATNAIRYMNVFSNHPARTWKTIQDSLQPYQARLGEGVKYFSMQIDEVASRIEYDEFNDKPLSGKYLLGFYSQRQELYRKKNKDEAVKETNN